MLKKISFLTVMLIVGCAPNTPTVERPKDLPHKVFMAGQKIVEFELDGHKYLSIYNVGLIHSASCQCKHQND